ncbi:MAG: hypothetical protein NVSMB46_05100 [Candidatus Saccharimonadales bacterium]
MSESSIKCASFNISFVLLETDLYTVTRMWVALLQNLVLAISSFFALLGIWVNRHGINIVAICIGAYIIRRFGAKIIIQLLRHTVRVDLYPTKIEREKRLRTLNGLISACVGVGVYILAIIFIIGEINPTYTTALFASAGLIGLGLGVGAQSLIKDFLNGIFIILENQYRLGDIVRINAIDGVVEAITIRTTIVRDLDGTLHHIPNGSITMTANKTSGYSSINEDITVARTTDLQRLEHIINHVGEGVAADAAFKNKIILAPHVTLIKGFDKNGIVVKITGTTAPSEQWLIKSELYKRLKVAFENNNIEIPTDQLTVRTIAKT